MEMDGGRVGGGVELEIEEGGGCVGDTMHRDSERKRWIVGEREIVRDSGLDICRAETI